jgi:hypothetical protein
MLDVRGYRWDSIFFALIQQPRPTRVLLWTVPLLLGGWVCMGILSMAVGIPLD